MFIQYKRTPSWDTSMTVVGTLPNGLAIQGVKSTAGAPTATVGKWASGAIVSNTATGIVYMNTSTTSTPTWTAIPTSGGTAPTPQRITSGTSATVTAGTELVFLDLATDVPNFTLTLPAAPTDGYTVTVVAGGTIAYNDPVVSGALTVDGGSIPVYGQPVTLFYGGMTFQYAYNAGANKYMRVQLV